MTLLYNEDYSEFHEVAALVTKLESRHSPARLRELYPWITAAMNDLRCRGWGRTYLGWTYYGGSELTASTTYIPFKDVLPKDYDKIEYVILRPHDDSLPVGPHRVVSYSAPSLTIYAEGPNKPSEEFFAVRLDLIKSCKMKEVYGQQEEDKAHVGGHSSGPEQLELQGL